MKKCILFCSALIIIFHTSAQNNPNNNSGLDSLKKDIHAIGNIFRKADTITITINGINEGDPNLVAFKKSLQQAMNVKKIDPAYANNTAVMKMLYKGKAADLWSNLPAETKQMFTVASFAEKAIKLNYNNVTANQNADNNTANNNQALQTNQNNTKQNTSVNNVLSFQTLGPAYVTKKLFKAVRQINAQNYFKDQPPQTFFGWKPDFSIWFDSAYLSDNGYAYTKYDTALNFNDGTDKAILFFITQVITNGEIQDCHACGALMSAAVFTKQPDNSFVLARLDTNFQQSDAWGSFSRPGLIKAGTSKYAILMSAGDMHSDAEYEGISYISTESLNEIFSINTLDATDNSGRPHSYHNETTLKFRPATDGGEYYLIDAVTTGTMENAQGKIVSAGKKEIYYFDTKKELYVLQPKSGVKQ